MNLVIGGVYEGTWLNYQVHSFRKLFHVDGIVYEGKWISTMHYCVTLDIYFKYINI